MQPICFPVQRFKLNLEPYMTAPMPLTTMPHQFDRYIANVTFEW